MELTKTMATFTVLWRERAEILRRASGRIEVAWSNAKDNARRAQPIILLFLCVMLVSVMAARVKLVHDMRVEAEQTAAAEAMRLDAEKQEAIRSAMIAAEQSAHREENEAVARILQTNAARLSEDGQRALVDFLWNRMEAELYGDTTLLEVCNRPSQYVGYTGDEPVVQRFYDIAAAELDNLRSGVGYRTLPPAFLYFEWSPNEIVFRTTYEITSSTQYWRVT